MPDSLNARDRISAFIKSRRASSDFVSPMGVLHVVHRHGEEVISDEIMENLIPDIGKQYILDRAYNSTGTYTHYMGLLVSTYDVEDAAETMGLLIGAPDEEEDTYDESIRQTWGTGAASTAPVTVTNSAAVTFSYLTTATVGGIFVVTGSGASSAKGNTGGTLICVKKFDPDKSMTSGDSLDITYSVTI